MTGQYRLRPYTVDAIRWTGYNTHEVIAWVEARGDSAEWVAAPETTRPASAGWVGYCGACGRGGVA